MDFLIIGLVSFLASGLTLFSGFGLGTILLPVFSIFFPVNAAVTMTAVVHFLNNIFKLFLLGQKANPAIIVRFGIPAMLASFVGAAVLLKLGGLPNWCSYSVGQWKFYISPLKVIVGLVILTFIFLEMSSKFAAMTFDRTYLPFGGILSGFFGGLSGHQGAFRSAFLMKCGLSKEGFVATGVVIACLVDLARLSVYGTGAFDEYIDGNRRLLLAAVLSAFLGAYLGNRVIRKVTFRAIQGIVSVMLALIAVLLGAGII